MHRERVIKGTVTCCFCFTPSGRQGRTDEVRSAARALPPLGLPGLFGVMSFPRKESQVPRDTGHSASVAALRWLTGEVLQARSSVCRESCSLVCRDLPAALFPLREEGPQRGLLHRAVLSVSVSMSNKRRPGTSLLSESEGRSGKTLRSGSDTLELASLNIPISVLTDYGRSYIRHYFGGSRHCAGEAAIRR